MGGESGEAAKRDADVARLTRLERARHDNQHRLPRTYETATARADKCAARARQLESVLVSVVDTRGDRFGMTVDGRTYTKRTETGANLKALLANQLDASPPETTTPVEQVGAVAGLPVSAQTTTVIEDEVRLIVAEAHVEISYNGRDWQTADPSMIVNRLERQIQRLPETLASTRSDEAAARTEAERAEARIGQPWEHAVELSRLRRRQTEIDEQLAEAIEPSPPPPSSTPPRSHATSKAPVSASTRSRLPARRTNQALSDRRG